MVEIGFIWLIQKHDKIKQKKKTNVEPNMSNLEEK